MKRTYTLSPAGPGARPGSCTAEAAHQTLSVCCLTNRQKFTPTSGASHGRKDADVSIPLVVSYICKEIAKLLVQASCWDNGDLLCTFLRKDMACIITLSSLETWTLHNMDYGLNCLEGGSYKKVPYFWLMDDFACALEEVSFHACLQYPDVQAIAQVCRRTTMSVRIRIIPPATEGFSNYRRKT